MRSLVLLRMSSLNKNAEHFAMCRHIKQSTVCLLVFICFVVAQVQADGYGPGKQDWGYIDVRPHAHMFYWLYYTTAENVQNYTDRPLVIWLQGGPGVSSAFGNFLEFGVIDQNNNTRNTTWVKHVNVLFIDNPVGCGYSYVDNDDLLAKNNTQIARDLVDFTKRFLQRHAEFQAVPLHIFGESYGGKMAPEFGLALHKAISRGEVACQLMSVSLVSPWMSPLDTMYAWPATLLQLGVIDKSDYHLIRDKINETKEHMKQKRWWAAIDHWAEIESLIMCITKGINFYDFLKYDDKNSFINCTVQNGTIIGEHYYKLPTAELNVQKLMRNEVATALNITNAKGYQIESEKVFTALASDFMRSAVHIVRKLLDNTPLRVNIIIGQLDLICTPSGTQKWIERMKWREKPRYLSATRSALVVNGRIMGYVKRTDDINVYWVNRAGHMVAADNPIAMNHILLGIVDLESSNK